MKGVEAGKFPLRIVIQTKTVTPDSYNEPIASWADTTTTWGDITTTGGGEFYAAQKLHAETTALIRLRYRAGVTTLNRIKHGTRVYEILAVNNVNEAGIVLHLSCKEVV